MEILIIIGTVIALIYYIYRQWTDPGMDIFFSNYLKHQGKFRKRNKQAEPPGEATPYPGQGKK